MALEQQLASLSAVDQRRVAAVVGACVADAAAQPLHWIYKADVLRQATDGKEKIEFHVPSANPFYRIDAGRNSCYGDEAYVVLKSLVQSEGLNTAHLIQATYKHFGPESEYENEITNAYAVGKENKVDLKVELPILGPWRNGCVKDFLRNYHDHKNPPGSSTDDQIDCAVRAIPLTSLYAGHPDLLFKVEEGLKVLQNSDIAITAGLAAARVLEKFILHENLDNVLETIIRDLGDPSRRNPQELDVAIIGQMRRVTELKTSPHEEVVITKFKNHCHLPESLQSAFHGAITAASYVDGVRATMRAGGCNASRSGIIGACLAAKEGFDAIPKDWRTKTSRYEETLGLALKLVQIPVESNIPVG